MPAKAWRFRFPAGDPFHAPGNLNPLSRHTG
jgi:hypothetical protein